MSASDIVFYWSVASRSFMPMWMLHEIGLPFRTVDTDIRAGRQKSADYLRINPMGKVPALSDHGAVITETSAICLYLADEYAHGTLAPRIGDPRRGPYLRWAVFATATLEPAIHLRTSDPAEARHHGWGDYASVMRTLETALEDGRTWILGEDFTAADVILGTVILMGMFSKHLPETGPIKAYHDRLAERPAAQNASAKIWPPELFAPPQA